MAQSYEKRLIRVLEYIHEHPDGDLSLDALAEVAAMSRFHWHRVFHGMTGETLAQAVRRIRMYRAAAWLIQSDQSIAEIATAVGHANVQSFTRIFRESFGMSPGAFRTRGELRSPLLKRREGDLPMFPVDIADHPARSLAVLPHKGAYTDVGAAFEKLSALFTTRNLWGHARGMLGVYYDDPNAVPEAELRSHAGIIIAAPIEMEAPLEPLDLPAGRYAVMHYKGPYAGLKAAYDYLYGEWLPKSGEDVGEHPPIEIYLNSPQEVAPEELLTDVCVPLA
ncbi:MAG: AraC family transcriptional regulator [Pseudomonadota bacterium]